MKIAVVRPIVVLAMVTACWSQVPAAMAAKGGEGRRRAATMRPANRAARPD
jgi:hypothetical protein